MRQDKRGTNKLDCGGRWLRLGTLAALAVMAQPVAAADGSRTFPEFQATALTGQTMSRQDLLGRRTILIITPSRPAAGETRAWVKQLRQRLGTNAPVRDIMAIEMPFFISKKLALSMARDRIPQQYWEETWLTLGGDLKERLGIDPDSEAAFVLVVDETGRLLMKANGTASNEKVSAIVNTLRTTHP